MTPQKCDKAICRSKHCVEAYVKKRRMREKISAAAIAVKLYLQEYDSLLQFISSKCKR